MLLAVVVGLFLCGSAQGRGSHAEDAFPHPANQVERAWNGVVDYAHGRGWGIFYMECQGDWSPVFRIRSTDSLCVIGFHARHHYYCWRRYHITEQPKVLRPSTEPVCGTRHRPAGLWPPKLAYRGIR